MYDKATREQALELLEHGMTYKQVSDEMGGKPSPAIIHKWSRGYVPVGKRGRQCLLTAEQKMAAIARVEQGEDYHSVATDVGCRPSSILQWRKMLREGGPEALLTKIDRYELLRSAV